MTASPEDLVKMFADGAMPTGDNFSDLIWSMTPRIEFDGTIKTIETQIAEGEIHFGPQDKGWSFKVEPANTLTLVPDTDNPIPHNKTTVNLGGWVGGFGRLGTGEDTDRFTGDRLLDTEPMGTATSGKWVTVLNPPKHIAGFEIVAATPESEPVKRKPLARMIRGIIGLEDRVPDVCYAVSFAHRPGIKPSLRRINPSRFGQVLRRTALELAIVALLLAAAVVFEVESYFTTQAGLDPSIAILVAGAALILWFLRRLLQLSRAYMSRIRMRWKAGMGADDHGNKQYSFEIKGPAAPGGGAAKTSYHLTALWG